MSRERLDVLAVKQGLAESREQAQRLIRAGQMLVNDQMEARPAARMSEDVRLKLKARPRFVSRGGEKLEEALRRFDLSVDGRACLDIGASTGGFTDCLLQHGAARVAAVDVGKGQLHWRLRQDPRVHVREGINARYLTAADLPFVPDLAVIDVSFISLTKILPAVVPLLQGDRELVALIKPQFEAGRAQVGKGGVVRSQAVREAVVDRIREFAAGELGLACPGVCRSPITGPAGNVEFLAHLKPEGGGT
jgi:23S rRNA (cytidine1920-2'-O)/16S rRNA (cytidine1409-2'-O)-methyltransferase